MAGVEVVFGFSGCLPCGAPHPGFGRRGSDVRVIMRTVVHMWPRCGIHVSCVLGPACKVKSDRFTVTRGYESLDLFVKL